MCALYNVIVFSLDNTIIITRRMLSIMGERELRPHSES